MPRPRSFPWVRMSDRELLEVRLCDLGLTHQGTWLEERIDRFLYHLELRRVRVVPHFWLSDEWLTPDGVIGIAMPFFLAHPRLAKLERRMMLTVEGGTRQHCMMLLRHEMGHVVRNAYQLQRRPSWRKMFGSATKRYPDSYRPNPNSKRFVQHLEGWYAQSHPDEDFAETFAVWLQPRKNWRKRYQGWHALKKLEYVDALMKELQSRPVQIRSRARTFALSRIKMTLGEYYDAKRAHYAADYPDTYDRDLQRVFERSHGRKRGIPASQFLRKHRAAIRELVCRWTGEYPFTLDQVIKQMMQRSRQLKLRAVGNQQQLATNCAMMVAVHSMQTLYRRDWHPL